MNNKESTSKSEKALIDEYLKLPYTIEVVPISPDEGGGFRAFIRELGEQAIVGDGETAAEAISDLEAVKHERFKFYVTNGIDIPRPKQLDEYSGRFVLRISRALHKALVGEAQFEGVSLNQYIHGILSARNKELEIFANPRKFDIEINKPDKSTSTNVVLLNDRMAV